MRAIRLIHFLICTWFLPSLLIGQENRLPNVIGPASNSTVGAVKGNVTRFYYQQKNPVSGANVAAVSLTLDQVYSNVTADAQGDFFLHNVPSNIHLKVYAWNTNYTDALGSFEITLNKGEIIEHNFSLSSNSSTYTDAIRVSSLSAIEQIEFLLHGPKYKNISIKAPWADGISHETDHYQSLSYDIEPLEFTNDNGIDIQMFAPMHMRETQFLYNQVIEGLDGLESYHSRKDKYRMALYQIAWGDGLENLDNLTLHNGCTTMETLDQAMGFLETFKDLGETAVTTNEIVKMIGDLKSVSSSGSMADIPNFFGKIKNQPSMKGMHNINNY